MSRINWAELSQAIKVAQGAVKETEQFPTMTLALRAQKAYEENPYDYSLLNAAQILSKTAQRKMFITRAELNKLYDSLYARGTKLGEIFSKELDRAPLTKAKMFPGSGSSKVKPGNVVSDARLFSKANAQPSLTEDYEKVANPVLVKALNSLFSDEKSYAVYDEKTAKRAQKICNGQLLALGYAPKKLDTFTGTEDWIVIQATYETPNGYSHVVIPLEVTKEGRIFLPNSFLSESGFLDLNASNLREHLISTAGRAMRVDGRQLLETLKLAKSKNSGINKLAMSPVEMAVLKMKSQAGLHDPNAVLGLRLEEQQEIPALPEAEKTAEHFEFAKRVTNPEGAAQFVFGNKLVNDGRDMVIRQLAACGHPHAQVKVNKVAGKDTIDYAVSLGGGAYGLMVPVKVSNNRLSMPKFAVASGQMAPLTRDGVSGLLKAASMENRVLASFSPSYELQPNDLLTHVRDCLNEGNIIGAEDSIRVLSQKDPVAYKTAIAMLLKYANDTGDVEDKDLNKTAERKYKEVPYFMTHKVFFPTEG